MEYSDDTVDIDVLKYVPDVCLLVPHECQLHAVKCSKSLDVNCNEYGKIMRHTCHGK